MLKTRVLSAVVAVVLLAGLFLALKTQGLYIISAIAVLISVIEYTRLSYKQVDPPMHIRVASVLLAFVAFLVTVFGTIEQAFGFIAVASVFFFTMSVLIVRNVDDLKGVMQIQNAGALGILYVGLFPGLAVRLLTFENGFVWFFGLLAIVFAGDTFAYLAGRTFGKRKLLEPVSPKKTIEGSLGGLAGSAIAGAIMGLFFLPDQPLWALIFSALITGAFAQVGDLFESLLKRVAEVKDSGAIMPGHGGILDRIDGVLFSAPVYYVLVRFLIAG